MPTFKKNTGFSLPGINFGTTGPTKTTGKTKITPKSKTYEGPDSSYGFEKWDKE